MLKGVRETHKQRFELLGLLLQLDLPASTMVEIMQPLEQVPEEEKEEVAARLIKEIQSGKDLTQNMNAQ